MILPARTVPARGRGIKVEFPGFERGLAFKLAVRNRAKRHPLYHLPVEVGEGVCGRTEGGIPVPVNTLGRWLFGVPGYAANAVFNGHEDPPCVWLPPEAPVEAVRLLREISSSGWA